MSLFTCRHRLGRSHRISALCVVLHILTNCTAEKTISLCCIVRSTCPCLHKLNKIYCSRDPTAGCLSCHQLFLFPTNIIVFYGQTYFHRISKNKPHCLFEGDSHLHQLCEVQNKKTQTYLLYKTIKPLIKYQLNTRVDLRGTPPPPLL